MPFYEYQCRTCGTRTEVFVRHMGAEMPAPECPAMPAAKPGDHEMQRVVSAFQRQMTEADKIAEAEARYGKEVNAALGATPDVGKLSRRYDALAKDLPRVEDA